ncbi:MAG TPA: DUF4440 domain-containing protein [Acidobacteriaceae bacterium]|jgi:uncharacterized protein (TIGR02246 family)|nr:DUF4440 domain-containing protein [Acidobacteriaceae bacterium]
MHRIRILPAILLFTATLFAQSAPDAIRHVLVTQQAEWNRGDVVAFMQSYANSPQTTFIGKRLEHGYQKILERYQNAYATRDAMGHLDFTDLDVRMLGPEHAVVTGRFHLIRTAAGGGDSAGVFSLVFEKTAAGWKIILDHTSSS